MEKFMNNIAKVMACMVICCMYVASPVLAQDDMDDDHQGMFSDIDETESHDVLSLLRQEEQFSLFMELIEKSGMEKSIREAEEITVFAPTNEAFKDLSVRRYEKIMEAEDQLELQNFVRAHIIPQRRLVSDFTTDQALDIGGDQHVRISRGGGAGFANPEVLNVGGARVGRADIIASNGVLHVMNGVVFTEEEGADRLVQPQPGGEEDFNLNPY